MAKANLTDNQQTMTVEEIIASDEKRVGLFGGTFNPPHLAHLIIADQVRDQLDLETVQFLPTAIPSHKSTQETATTNQRVDMVDLAIQDNPYFSLNLTDINRGGLTYTIDTVRELKEANPETTYYFIIGGDSVENLNQWKEIDELMKLVQFVAVGRPNYPMDSDYPVIWIDVLAMEISSTMIRQKIKDGSTVNYLVPQAVLDYINEEGLYKNIGI